VSGSKASAVDVPPLRIGRRPRAQVPPRTLWENVDRLVASAPRYSDLEVHGLQHLGAGHAGRLGPLPPQAAAAQRWAAVCSMLAPLVLERVVAAADEPVVLMKGPELALRYPDPAWRPYRDVDVLVGDAESVWERLRDSGFEETGDPALYVDLHHLRPLVFPGLPLIVEVHSRPKWIDGMEAPDTAELIETAVPSQLPIDGLLTLEPARHAVAVAAHAWAHVPLSRVVHLIDIAAVSDELEPYEPAAVAKSWGVERVWRVTAAAMEGLLYGGRRPVATRLWARHLWDVRERTVLERHVQQWLAPFWALPAARALRVTGVELGREVLPSPDETWRQKLGRTWHALRNAFTRLSDHNRSIQATPPGKDEES
jgi:hypothetical protein